MCGVACLQGTSQSKGFTHLSEEKEPTNEYSLHHVPSTVPFTLWCSEGYWIKCRSSFSGSEMCPESLSI